MKLILENWRKYMTEQGSFADMMQQQLQPKTTAPAPAAQAAGAEKTGEIVKQIISLTTSELGKSAHHPIEILLDSRGKLPSWVNGADIEKVLISKLAAGSKVRLQSAPWYEVENQEAAIQAALQKLGGLVHVQLNPTAGDELDLYVTTWSVVNGKVSQSEGAFGSVGGK